MPRPPCRCLSRAHRLVLEHECAIVELAAHWADLNHPDSQSPLAKPLPGTEQGRQLGGQGTPEVLEFAAAELGAQMETTVGWARALMADAVDLRHRLPELWQLNRPPAADRPAKPEYTTSAR